MRDLAPAIHRTVALAAACLVCLASTSAPALAGVGAWGRLALTSGLRDHSVVHDPVHQRLIVFGGLQGGVNSNAIHVLPLAGPAVWQRIDPAGGRPAPRQVQAAIYDPVRDRLIVHGGKAAGVFGDVWAITLSGNSTWTQLSPSGTPPSARYGHLGVYDAVRDRVLLIGGHTGSARLNDVWALSLSGPPAWQQLAPTGTPPLERWGHAGIYDPTADRVVLFGGTNFVAPLADTWALTLSGTPAWSNITPAGGSPSGRWSHTAAYDATRQAMFVFGGYDSGNFLNDVWSFDLGGMQQWAPVTAGGVPPEGRFGSSWVFDPPRDRFVLFGGGTTSGELDDLWSLSLAGEPTWQPELGSSSRATSRANGTAVYDPVDHRMWIFGGHSAFKEGFRNDVWWLPLDGNPRWVKVTSAGTSPSARHSHASVYDAAHHRILIFGGIAQSGAILNELWALTLGAEPAWEQLSPGPGPAARHSHIAILDPVRNRLIVFGGNDNSQFFNDAWALSLADGGGWTLLTPSGTPPTPRMDMAAAYDPVRDRMLISGGFSQPNTYHAQFWELTLSGGTAWNLLPVSSPQRVNHSMVYDAAGDRMLFFGGINSAAARQNDVREFPLSSFSVVPLFPSGPLPSPRGGHAAVIDPVGHRMLVFGESFIGGGETVDSEVWSMGLNSPTLSTTTPRQTSGVQLAAPYPDPARGAVTLGFALAQSGRVTLYVYDVTGRRVATLADGVFAPGPHSLRWDRRTASGQRARAGLYFCELVAEGGRSARKVVLVE